MKFSPSNVYRKVIAIERGGEIREGMHGKVKTYLSVRCFAFLEKRGVVIKRGSRVKQLVLYTRSREKGNFAGTRKLHIYVKELREGGRIYRLDSRKKRNK